MKKIVLLILFFFTICFVSTYYIEQAHADSGWDSSYDGGSSSSDWGSSSSSWSSSDWGGSSGSSGGSYSGGSGFVILVIIMIVVIWAIAGVQADSNSATTTNTIREVSDELLAKYGINREEFSQMVYDKYVEIQNAWMNFDYDSLKELLTDELYNTYFAQLEALKVKKQQNIMSDYQLISSKIIDVKEENGRLSVISYLHIKMYDYVVNNKKEVVRGSDKRKIDIEYHITFVKPLNAKVTNICPNCGGVLNDTTRENCEHCGTIIVKSLDKYVMSKKTNIGQR